jgi:hypothetical protein
VKDKKRDPVAHSTLDWRRSTYCGNEACVEVAISDSTAFVRNSRVADAYLVFDGEEWTRFLAGVRNHEFDID